MFLFVWLAVANQEVCGGGGFPTIMKPLMIYMTMGMMMVQNFLVGLCVWLVEFEWPPAQAGKQASSGGGQRHSGNLNQTAHISTPKLRLAPGMPWKNLKQPLSMKNKGPVVQGQRNSSTGWDSQAGTFIGVQKSSVSHTMQKAASVDVPVGSV